MFHNGLLTIPAGWKAPLAKHHALTFQYDVNALLLHGCGLYMQKQSWKITHARWKAALAKHHGATSWNCLRKSCVILCFRTKQKHVHAWACNMARRGLAVPNVCNKTLECQTCMTHRIDQMPPQHASHHIDTRAHEKAQPQKLFIRVQSPVQRFVFCKKKNTKFVRLRVPSREARNACLH